MGRRRALPGRTSASTTCSRVFFPQSSKEHWPRAFQSRLAGKTTFRKRKSAERASYSADADGRQHRTRCQIMLRRREGDLRVRRRRSQFGAHVTTRCRSSWCADCIHRQTRNRSRLGGSLRVRMARPSGAALARWKYSFRNRRSGSADSGRHLPGLAKQKGGKSCRLAFVALAGFYAVKEEPHPHVEVAFGFFITNCAPSRFS